MLFAFRTKNTNKIMSRVRVKRLNLRRASKKVKEEGNDLKEPTTTMRDI